MSLDIPGSRARERQEKIRTQLREMAQEMAITFLTPSAYAEEGQYDPMRSV